MAINDDWLRAALGLLVTAGSAALVSYGTVTTQIDGIKERQTADMVQLREIFIQRDRVDSITLAATNERFDNLQRSVTRLEQRMDAKFGWIDRDGFVYAQLVAPPILDYAPKIFDKELKQMRSKLDAQILLLKAGKLNSEDKRDAFYSLELDYEILKGWQIWCETSPERRSQCQMYFKKEE